MDEEYDCSSAAALLLELAAGDDLPAFRRAVEQAGAAIRDPAPWYGPRSGSKGAEMGYEMRTPLQVAALYGSLGVMSYVLSRSGVDDVNRPCGSDGATALHCAVAGGAAGSREAILLLLNASADVDVLDAAGRRPADLVRRRIRMRQAQLEGLLLRKHDAGGGDEKEEDTASSSSWPSTPASPPQKKEYPPDSTLPDIASGLYSTDEFRMYVYKVAPCPRAYSHDWTDCPFAHPGENARRRDPRRLPYYSPAPCPEFRRSVAVVGAASASCPRGDACEFAHGVFESWLHPAQYRTRMCKDEGACGRRVCFFAHSQEQLRQPAESVDLEVISAMGLGQGQGQGQLKPAVTGLNDLGKMEMLGFSPRAKQQHPQFLPSGYRAPTLLDGTATSPCSPRTPRAPKPSFSLASIGHQKNHPSPQARSRAAAFVGNRSLSFAADRSSCGRAAVYLAASNLSSWGSADGKLDWGIKGEELTKLRKTNMSFAADRGQQMLVTEPDVSWVQSVVIDGSSGSEDDDLDIGGSLVRLNSGGFSRWATADPVYLEHEQLVA